jgi:hypothetical protein
MKDITRDVSFYQPSRTILPAYFKQAAVYLNKMTGKPIEECQQFIRSIPIKDPKVTLNVRNMETGDKVSEETTFTSFIETCRKENLILAPTFTAYISVKDGVSFLGRYITKKMHHRNVYKKKMFESKMKKDKQQEMTFKALGSTAKELNNSASGAQSVANNPIVNRSAHPTLTSVCRVTTSHANMCNEFFLAGNRPYFTGLDVINHIVSTITVMDHKEIEVAIEKYNLHIPNNEEVWSVIWKSMKKYNANEKTTDRIKTLISSLTSVERVGFCYIYDLKHLSDFNPDLVKGFILKLSLHDEVTETITDSFGSLSNCLKTMILFQYGFKFKGMGLDVILGDPENVKLLDKAASSVIKTLNDHEELINAFWLSKCQTLNHSYMDYVRREVVVLSDTDSTVFTNQEWCKLITGSYNFDELSYKVASTTTCLADRCVAHNLKIMSKNFNIDNSEMTRIKMKNEYYFVILALTSVAKHYACMKWGQEGNILHELESEIKGVALRNSAWPVDIYNRFTNYLTDLLKGIVEGKIIDRKAILGPILDLENEFINKIKSGDYTLYNKIPVNSAESYKKPGSSPYASYLMWNAVFADKYGPAPEPMYFGVKVPVNLPNITAINNYLDNISDKSLSERFRNWFKETGKTHLDIIVLPEPVLASSGVPKEIIPIINPKNLLSNVTGGFYLILNSFGFNPRNKDYSIAINDLFDQDNNFNL